MHLLAHSSRLVLLAIFILTDRFPTLALLSCLDARLGRCAAMPEAIRLIAGFDDMAVVGQSVQKCCSHLRITKYTRPFAEGQIRRDDHARMLIKLGEQME